MNELSLFTGAGGGVLGSILLGHRIVGYVEIDEYCQKIIPQGKFKGRLGKIEEIFLDSDGMSIALIRPYHLKYGKPYLLSYSQHDVRTYLPITDEDIVK